MAEMPRDDHTLALLFEGPATIPVRIGFLPATWKKYRDELSEIVARYPDITGETCGERDYDNIDSYYAEGDTTDAWGCRWSNVKEGIAAIVTKHPLPTRESVAATRDSFP